MSDGPGRDAATVTTAEQLESMSPADRQASFDAAVVTDLSQANQVFLARVRARLERRIAAQDRSPSV